MKVRFTRTVLAAMGTLLCCSAQADEQLRYSGLEQRLAVLEAQVAAQQGVHSASYTEGTDAAASGGCGCNDHSCCGGVCFQPSCYCCDGGCYAYVDLLWVRPHVNEDWVGKLSEEHLFSTRTVIGYENCCGLGARARWWQFDHGIDILDPGSMSMDVDVLDLEATNRICFRATDLLFAGGFRYAHWGLTDDNGEEVTTDAVGLTAAVDGRTPLCTYCNNRWSFVYGARWSILGGDWHGDNNIINSIGPAEVRDDNWVVTELYTGVEYMFCWNGCDMFTRGTLEMQNWSSDVLGEPGIGNGIAPLSVGSTNSVGFVGVGVQLGMLF